MGAKMPDISKNDFIFSEIASFTEKIPENLPIIAI
jgi:hypothetical protein